MVRDAGFSELEVHDWTPLFMTTLQREVDALVGDHEAFLADFSVEDFDYLIDRWERKSPGVAAAT